MKYISIYGERIKGKIVSELENTVVVEDKKRCSISRSQKEH